MDEHQRKCTRCNNDAGQVYMDFMWAECNPRGPTCGRVIPSRLVCRNCLDTIIYGSGAL